jgi:tape measure domain-containing protein
MSDIQLRVTSDSSQAQNDLQRLNQSVSKIEKTTTSASKTLAGLATSVAGAFAAYGGFSAINRASDAFVNIENRIALVTGRTKELAQVQKQLLDVSVKTRGSIQGSVEVFNRFGRALQGTGVGTQQLVKATEAVQKAVTISGAGAASAEAAIIQLGQGLASGQLRGQELLSVLEQTPRVAQAIADELGVGIGALRGLAEAGKLTTDVVFNALLNQSENLNKEFSLLAPTFSQASQQLGQAAQLFTSEFSKGFSISEGFAGSAFNTAKIITNLSKDIQRQTFLVSTYLSGVVQDTLYIGRGVANVFKAIASEVGKTLPDIRGPVGSLFLDVRNELKKFTSFITNNFGPQFRASITDPIIGGLEFITGYTVSDTRLRRAFTQLFNSRDVESFRKNLDLIAEVIKSPNFARFSTVIGDVRSAIKVFFLDIKDGLIYIGLLRDRLLEISNIRIDRFTNGLKEAAAIFRRFSADIVMPNLGESIDALERFSKRVIRIFQIIWDEVIGHSWWTDTIESVINTSSSLWSKVSSPLLKFSNNVIEAFRVIYDKVIGNSYWTDLVDSINNVSFSKASSSIAKFGNSVKQQFKKVADNDLLKDMFNSTAIGKLINEGDAAKIASIVGGGLLIGILAALVGGSFQAAVSAAIAIAGAQGLLLAGEKAFGELFDTSLIGKLASSLGSFAGFLGSEFIKAIPEIVGGLYTAANEFGKAFLQEFGVIGKVISSVLGAVTGGNQGIITTLLFGTGIAALFGETDKVEGFLKSLTTYIDPLIKAVTGGNGFGLLGQLIGGVDFKALTGGVGLLFATLTGNVNTLTGLTGSVPLLMYAFLGKDIAGKLIGDTIRNVAVSSVKIITDSLSKLSKSPVFETVITKLFGTTDGKFATAIVAFKDLAVNGINTVFNALRNVTNEENRKAFLSGQIDLARFIFGENGTPEGLKNFGTIFGASIKTLLNTIITQVSAGFSTGKDILSDLFGKSKVLSTVATQLSSVGALITTFFASTVSKMESRIGPLGVVGRGLFGKLAFGAVIAGFLALTSGVANAAAQSMDELNEQTTGQKWAEYGLIGAALLGTAGLAKLFGLLKAAIVGLVTLVGGTLAALTVGLFAVIGGVIGLWLFGEGDSFWASVGDAGRRVLEFFNILDTEAEKRKNVLSNIFDKTKIDGKKINTDSLLQGVDFEGMSSKEFARIEATAKRYQEILERNKRAQIENGELTAKQQRDQIKAQELLNKLLDEAKVGIRPQDIASNAQRIQELFQDRTFINFRFGIQEDEAGFNKLWKSLFNAGNKNLSEFINKQFPDALSAINSRINSVVETGIYDNIAESSDTERKALTDLQNKILEVRDDLGPFAIVWAKLFGRGEQINSEIAQLDRLTTEYEQLAATIAIYQQDKLAGKAFKKDIDDLVSNLEKFDIKLKSTDLGFGSKDQIDEIELLVKEYENLLDVADKASPANRAIILRTAGQVKGQIEQAVESVISGSSIDKLYESLAKRLGVALSPKDINITQLTQLREAQKELEKKERERASIALDNVDAYKRLTEEIALQKKLVESLSKNEFKFGFDLAASAGINIKESQYGSVGPGLKKQIDEQAKYIATLKEQRDKLAAAGDQEAAVAGISKLLATAEKGVERLNKRLEDLNKNFSERLSGLISEAGAQLQEAELFRVSPEGFRAIRDELVLAKGLREQLNALGDNDIEKAIQLNKRLRDVNATIAQRLAAEANPVVALQKKLTGAGIQGEEFFKLPQEARDQIINYGNDINSLNNFIESLGDITAASGKEAIDAYQGATLKVIELKKELDVLKGTAALTFDQLAQKLSGFGFTVPTEKLALGTPDQLKVIEAQVREVEKLDRLRKDPEQAANAAGLTLQYNNQLETLRKITLEFQKQATESRTIRDTFAKGLKELISGSGSMKSILVGILDAATTRIVDTLITKFSDYALSFLDSILDSFLNSIDFGLPLLSKPGSTRANPLFAEITNLGDATASNSLMNQFSTSSITSGIGSALGFLSPNLQAGFGNILQKQTGITVDDEGIPLEVGAIEDVFSGFTKNFDSLLNSDFLKGFEGILGGLGSSLGGLFSGGGGGGLSSMFSSVSSWWSGLTFDSGGVVPGSIGSPQLAMVHAGETILPTHKQDASSFGNSQVVNINITGDISRQTRKEILSMGPKIADIVQTNLQEKRRL